MPRDCNDFFSIASSEHTINIYKLGHKDLCALLYYHKPNKKKIQRGKTLVIILTGVLLAGLHKRINCWPNHLQTKLKTVSVGENTDSQNWGVQKTNTQKYVILPLDLCRITQC